MSQGGTIVWFRQDLRLHDNPAFHAAAARGVPVIPMFIWSPTEEGAWPLGAAQRWWLHESLQALDQSLRALGSRLVISRGPALDALRSAAAECGADEVNWNDRYEPAAVAVAAAVAEGLATSGIGARRFNSAVLYEPATMLNASGLPYRVYTAFFRALLERASPGRPLPAPARMAHPRVWPRGVVRESLRLVPDSAWHRKLAACWQPGEAGAHQQLDRFLEHEIKGYGKARDIPSVRGTSRLSPHLHFGEIGARQIWHSIAREDGGSRIVAELGWREFAYHLLHHFPGTAERPLRREFERFPWKSDAALLSAWQRGVTGLPLVDAGMRELWATGWMHNRVRMVAASLLVKNLMIPWQAGARWFWDTLVDADLANNTLNWQWVAGCGVDAAPYFRIFNPRTQAARFDPEGRYIQRWIPEIGTKTSGYPDPIVDPGESRAAALEAFRRLRAERPGSWTAQSPAGD